jgi:hypothetical protein
LVFSGSLQKFSRTDPQKILIFIKSRRKNMRLNAPKTVTWWIAVLLGILGILGALVDIPFISEYAFWFVAIAFILLALATYFKDL